MVATITPQQTVMSGKRKNSTDNVFRIHLQSTFKQLVRLPPVNSWDRASLREGYKRDQIQCHIRTKGIWFFCRKIDWTSYDCVLTPKGYFIIYLNSNINNGYILNLCRATEIRISAADSAKECVLVTMKWEFGTVKLKLFGNQLVEWPRKLMDVSRNEPVSGETTLLENVVQVPHETCEKGTASLNDCNNYRPSGETMALENAVKVPYKICEEVTASLHDCNDYRPSGETMALENAVKVPYKICEEVTDSLHDCNDYCPEDCVFKDLDLTVEKSFM